MVVFWEVWCPHCRNHMPELVKTYDTYKGKGMNVVALTRLSKGKTKEDVTKFMTDNSLNYPVGKEDGKLARTFGVVTLPLQWSRTARSAAATCRVSPTTPSTRFPSARR